MLRFTKYTLFITFLIGISATFSRADVIHKLSIFPKTLTMLSLPDSACIASDLFKADTISCYVNNPDDYCIHVDISASVDSLANHTVTYTWDLGDGNTKNGVNFEHCYKTYGSYKVVLRATSEVSGIKFEDVTEELIEINNIVIISPQKADASSTQFPYYFDGTASFIDNNFEVEKYYWSFDDGNYSCGEIVFHNYTKKGIYKIRLIVEGVSETGEKKRICGSYSLEIK